MILLTFGAGVAGADRSDNALTLLDRGIALYEMGQLDEARKAFIAARDLVPDKPNPHRWLGLVEARLHHCREAIVELELFITHTAAEDPRHVEAAAVRDQCRGELAPQLGTVLIETVPAAAEVRIDQPDAPVLGLTPQAASLVEGRHVVYLAKPGFVVRSAELQIVRGANRPLHIELQAAPHVELQAPLDSRASPRRRSRAWIAGVVVGVAVVAAAVGLGVGLGLSREPTPQAITPIMGQP